MTLIGLDLNATRARAVHGPGRHLPAPLPLEDDHRDLPAAVSLELRQPVVGRAGALLCRTAPHLACLDFLALLGSPRVWNAGRHRLDAGRALALVLDTVHRRAGRNAGLGLTLPAYLSAEQREHVAQVARQARWSLLGTLPTPVAAAASDPGALPADGLVLVGDIDGHAFTWSLVSVSRAAASATGVGRIDNPSHAAPGHPRCGAAHLFAALPLPRLHRHAWLGRLLDGIANRCVRISRRDPRESAETEQALYDQLVRVLGGLPAGPVELVAQAPGWYQHLVFRPEELAGFAGPLPQQAVAEAKAFLAACRGEAGAVLLTAEAAGLPGLIPAVEEALGRAVHVLDADAVARVAHELAIGIQLGELPPGHQTVFPLPPGETFGTDLDQASHASATELDLREVSFIDEGPARLQFGDEDYLLTGAVFTLGRAPNCDLIFETTHYPTVSARHCEIIFDRQVYTLRDRSRHGTLVNEHPVRGQVTLQAGDWIRLGPEGPTLRFVGQTPGYTAPVG
jgi:hypothetical protein